ncbi:RDD family protein [Ideonella sp. A 288]|uniref:RDD family protein n=1 Tax=Ideonella sp. A 288 TaxID=1962181 RepID=UPI000B4BD555|nr:RDD family protein [Ideonella sp. A 288]
MAIAKIDPRQWVTPEDLDVSPDLLGLPLARPWRRAAAMAVDLAAIGVVASLGNGWWFAALVVLAGAQAWAERRGRSAPRWAWALAALLALAGLQQGWRSGSGADGARELDADVTWEAPGVGLIVRRGDEAASSASVASVAGGGVPSPAAVDGAASGPAVAASAVPAGRPVDAAQAIAAAASAMVAEVATAARIAELEAELAEARKPAPLKWRDRWLGWWDDLARGYGWSIAYFSLLPARWRGQTLGKRWLGLRVVELTGKPMTVLQCLKRYGGYAAGMATGGLGFLQVLWDPNRQALHDKAAHTVVIDLRVAQRLSPEHWAALRGTPPR